MLENQLTFFHNIYSVLSCFLYSIRRSILQFNFSCIFDTDSFKAWNFYFTIIVSQIFFIIFISEGMDQWTRHVLCLHFGVLSFHVLIIRFCRIFNEFRIPYYQYFQTKTKKIIEGMTYVFILFYFYYLLFFYSDMQFSLYPLSGRIGKIDKCKSNLNESS